MFFYKYFTAFSCTRVKETITALRFIKRKRSLPHITALSLKCPHILSPCPIAKLSNCQYVRNWRCDRCGFAKIRVLSEILT